MQRKSSLANSTRVAVAREKKGQIMRAIEGTNALNAALPRASFRQVSEDTVAHANSLHALSKESKLIGRKLAGKVKKPLAAKRKVIRRRPWPRQSVRRIPLRTVSRR